MGTPAAADCWPEATEINNNVESARVMLKRHMRRRFSSDPQSELLLLVESDFRFIEQERDSPQH
jgi:hypothetical protein